MKTLIFASNPTLYPSKFSPWKPKTPYFHHSTTTNQKPKPHANNAKGFSSTTPPAKTEISSKKSNKNNDDDEIPQEVFNRMIGRILVSVGVPMGLGLAFLQAFGVLKEQHLWDVPMWVPFMTTLLTFGASALGIAYGTLSTSLDAEREGSFLGVEQVEKNWVEMWKEEDESQRLQRRNGHALPTMSALGIESLINFCFLLE